jgi:5-(carboxyamino)imidazole ribonucleotide synthase
MNGLTILPGATIGVLGSGQLGRMFTIAARQMGYLVHTFSPEADTPTGQVADVEITAPYDDLDAVRAFAGKVDVVTFEFENVPAATAEAAAMEAPVRPAGAILHTTQNRAREKSSLQSAGFPVTPFEPVHDVNELHDAITRLGSPGVLKTSAWGYDGKGQIRIESPADAGAAWRAINTTEAIYERFIDFERELSIVAARGMDGAIVEYGPIENTHSRHILDLSICPAQVSQDTAREAIEIARGVLDAFDLVGVMCVEFFLTPAGELMINELAPRPHNSGHFTIDACVSSQFEQQVRAVCGLPLGSTRQHQPAAMVNLLGDLWMPPGAEPDWLSACADPEVKLHLYGKLEARPGRKMGHITVLAETSHEAARHALAARDALLARVTMLMK